MLDGLPIVEGPVVPGKEHAQVVLFAANARQDGGGPLVRHRLRFQINRALGLLRRFGFIRGGRGFDGRRLHRGAALGFCSSIRRAVAGLRRLDFLGLGRGLRHGLRRGFDHKPVVGRAQIGKEVFIRVFA